MDTPDLSNLNLPEKEQKILESAIKVFSEKGFSATTTSEIAKNAGVAEGTIFRYFKTKKDILRGILIQTINIVSKTLVIGTVEKIFQDAQGKDLRSVLKEFILDRLTLADKALPMFRVILTEALFHEDVRDAIYENIISRALEVFRSFHKLMVEQGMMRRDIQPETLLRSIMANIAALIAQKTLFGDKLKLRDLDQELDEMLDILMYGVADSSTAGK